MYVQGFLKAQRQSPTTVEVPLCVTRASKCGVADPGVGIGIGIGIGHVVRVVIVTT
jgi:hypothetical protein